MLSPQADTQSALRPTSRLADASLTPGWRPQVLLADDDPAVLDMIGLALEQEGFSIRRVTTGDGAWAALSSDSPPTLAILDWEMPGPSGVELCRRVRRDIHHTYVYIILITGRTEETDVLEGLGAGADDYIRKPVFLDLLLARIRPALRILEMERKLRNTVPPAEKADSPGPPGTSLAGALAPAVFDREACLERLGRNQRLLARLIELFITTAPGQLIELRRAAASQDSAAIAASAHALCGAGANVGAAEVCKLAAAMEAGGAVPTAAQVADLERALTRYQQEAAPANAPAASSAPCR